MEIVDNTPDVKPSEILNAAGDENQMIARKAGRAKTAIDPEKAVEKAAKVSLVTPQNPKLTESLIP